MKKLIVVYIVSLFWINVFGNEISLENKFFSVVNTALATPNLKEWAALSLDKKKTNAEALYLLCVKASNAIGLSNVVHLTVIASADETFDRYINAIPHSPADLEDFANSSDSDAALFLLEDSLKILARVPPPHAYLNVSPPIWTPGDNIAGMDPNGIKDSKARAEYERRISANNQAIEEMNTRALIQNKIVSLKIDMKNLVRDIQSETLNAKVMASSLPDEVKKEILGK